MKFTKRNKKWGIISFLLILFFAFALYPLPSQKPIRYFDRETGTIKTEKIAGEKWLVWLYNNPVGEATLWTLAKRKIASSVYGEMMDKESSVEKIQPFIEDFGIEMKDFQKQNYHSFNEFFIRKLKPDSRPIDMDSSVVISPSDGKISAYENLGNSDFYIKGHRFDVQSFLNNPNLAKKYENGTLLIFRLAPPDYHRFHFPISGTVSENIKIKGDYYSVNPLALRRNAEIFWLNKREYSIIKNPLFGEVIMAEVGATFVGSIEQTFKGNTVKKGEEKGYFKFGGSTVVLIFEKNKIKVDADLLYMSSKNFETTVKMGEEIGVEKKRIP